MKVSTLNPHLLKMPSSPLKPCAHPGCRNLVQAGKCDQHRRTNARAWDATVRQADPSLAEAARIRGTPAWKQTRALHRDLEPFCRDPFNRHGKLPPPARESHHIRPLATNPELAFDLANLAGLCVPCHRQVEALEAAGQPTVHLFAGGPRRLGETRVGNTTHPQGGQKV